MRSANREDLVSAFEAELGGEQAQVVLVLPDAVGENLERKQGLG